MPQKTWGNTSPATAQQSTGYGTQGNARQQVYGYKPPSAYGSPRPQQPAQVPNQYQTGGRPPMQGGYNRPPQMPQQMQQFGQRGGQRPAPNFNDIQQGPNPSYTPPPGFGDQGYQSYLQNFYAQNSNGNMQTGAMPTGYNQWQQNQGGAAPVQAAPQGMNPIQFGQMAGQMANINPIQLGQMAQGNYPQPQQGGYNRPPMGQMQPIGQAPQGGYGYSGGQPGGWSTGPTPPQATTGYDTANQWNAGSQPAWMNYRR